MFEFAGQYEAQNVAVPTVSDHCDVHVRVHLCKFHSGRVAYVGVYDRTRGRWLTNVGGDGLGTTAVMAALTLCGVSQRSRASVAL